MVLGLRSSEREKERENFERAYVGWPVLFWLCRVEIITEHGQDVQMFINDQHGRIIIRILYNKTTIHVVAGTLVIANRGRFSKSK